jgi:hypothetical protein
LLRDSVSLFQKRRATLRLNPVGRWAVTTRIYGIPAQARAAASAPTTREPPPPTTGLNYNKALHATSNDPILWTSYSTPRRLLFTRSPRQALRHRVLDGGGRPLPTRGAGGRGRCCRFALPFAASRILGTIWDCHTK